MFVFGHLGITLGIAFILFQFVLPRIGIRLKKINYLFIALGAILPDLIDKPVGRILLGESVANGRLFGHTLLFVLILVHFFFLQKKTCAKRKSCFFSQAFFSKEKLLVKLFFPRSLRSIFGQTFPKSLLIKLS